MTSKIKICVLGTRGFPNVQGGVETHCENLYPRLVQLGCDVTVFTRPVYVSSDIHEFNGVRLISLKCPRHKFLEAFVHTFRGVFAARAAGCDLVHIHAIGPAFFVPLARVLGLKVVMTNHGPDYERLKWGMGAKIFLKFSEKIGSIWANKVISISATIADNLKRNYKTSAVIIPNGVHIPLPVCTDVALHQFGLKKSKYILSVGRFVPEKGFHDLLKAFGKLNTDWKLVLVGSADHDDKYSRELKEDAAQNKNIVLTGFQKGERLRELFAHSGLFVLPSYHEGLPIVLLEAMSYGLSCILSDIAANSEVGLDAERYFKAGDVLEIAQKLKEFMDRGPLTDIQRQGQFSMILGRYNWDNIAQKTMDVYRLLVGKKEV